MLRVRIRGIYATALTYIFSKDFKVVQQSFEIAQRFNQEIIREPAEVTIKNTEEDKGVLIVMSEKDILDYLKQIFKNSFIWKSPVKLYEVIEVNIEECKHNGIPVEPCISRGMVVKSSIDGKIILSQPKAVGRNLMIWRGEGKTYFSEHIRDPEIRAKLLLISSYLNRKGYNVKWRSNSAFATLDEIKEEISKLVSRVESERYDGQGEEFYIITLSLPDKLEMDEIRKKVVPTAKYHHMLKMSFGKEIDDIESKSVECPKELLKELISDFMQIEHIKFDNKIKLKGGKVIDYNIYDCGYEIILRREFNNQGVYDGLEVPKEPGDYDIMYVNSNNWYQIHKYYSKNNELKGIYINISTPPELLRGKIRYLDLELDVVVKEGGEVYIIDREELEKKRDKLTESLYNTAIRKAEELVKNIKDGNLRL